MKKYLTALSFLTNLIITVLPGGNMNSYTLINKTNEMMFYNYCAIDDTMTCNFVSASKKTERHTYELPPEQEAKLFTCADENMYISINNNESAMHLPSSKTIYYIKKQNNHYVLTYQESNNSCVVS